MSNYFIKFLAIVTVCLYCVGCFQQPNKEKLTKEEDLIQISLSTNGSKQDTAGGFVIELDKNFIGHYYGGSQSGLVGNYVGKIEQSDWHQLIKLLDHKQIKDTILSERSFEDNYFDLLVKFRHKNYYITGFYSSTPQYIKEICEQILFTKKKITFTKSSENHFFEAEAYKIKPNTDSINFVVPKVRS